VTNRSPTAASPGVELRRAASRFHTTAEGLDSWHSFSFGPHHDPANINHGLLVASNEERISSGAGFEPHPHREMEIVTWVLSGSLVHEDSAGNTGVVRPLLAARMSAGTGIIHSERNESRRHTGSAPSDEPVHFVQMWVPPDDRGLAPSYEQAEVDEVELTGRLVPIASGLPQHANSTAIRISNRQAGLLAGRLDPGVSVELPDAPFVHLFVAAGAVLIEGDAALGPGDAARYRAAGARRVTATEPSQLLVWEMLATAFE
jgi:redox-sensitive bicupin YhaK (pirin superfamily)